MTISFPSYATDCGCLGGRSLVEGRSPAPKSKIGAAFSPAFSVLILIILILAKLRIRRILFIL